jgi:hypothetical protein
LCVLTFNDLLRAVNLDPVTVRLVRHRDPNVQRAVFEAAIRGDQAFDEYQEHQGTDQVIAQFRAATYLAGFVADPMTGDTVFVGIWERLGDRAGPSPRVPLLIPGTHSAAVAFETRRNDALAAYRGRVVIDWGDGARVWVQRADNQPKPILEIRRELREPEFPGFARFRRQLDQIEQVPATWRAVLSNARGIYLLVHRESGQQYVGSAYGASGYFGRWTSYADGHGGNAGLKELGASASAFDVAILEVVGSEAMNEDIFAREALWKEKLGTRVKGLNRN